MRRARVLGGAVFVAVSAAAGLGWAAGSGRLDWPIDLPSLAETLRRPELRLRRVAFVGLERLEARDLWARARVATRTPLVDVEPRTVEARIAEHPRVERAQVLRIPPDRLLVGVLERVPVAVDEAGRAIDARGARFPLLPGERERLPRLVGRIAGALPLLRAARELDVRVAAVRARGRRDLRFRPRGADVEIRVGADVRASLHDWRRLRASGLVDAYGAGEVDLRFAGSAVLRGLRERRGGEDGTS